MKRNNLTRLPGYGEQGEIAAKIQDAKIQILSRVQIPVMLGTHNACIQPIIMIKIGGEARMRETTTVMKTTEKAEVKISTGLMRCGPFQRGVLNL